MKKQEIQKLLQYHQMWLANRNTGERLNLRGATLTDIDLSMTDLTGAFLSRTDLTGANLYATNLYGVDLTESVLVEADLTGTNLCASDFIGADLSNANLSAANLSQFGQPLIMPILPRLTYIVQVLLKHFSIILTLILRY